MLQYFPTRDGPIDSTWNLSYSGDSQALWAADDHWANGTSSHSTTKVEAAVQLQWFGTAVWLFGQADAGTYSIELDGGSLVLGKGSQQGLLFSQTGLEYGQHLVVLSVVKTGVTFSGGIVTTVLGEPGSTIHTSNISVVTSNVAEPPANPFFYTNGEWDIADSYEYPRLNTSVNGVTASFVLNDTSAFAIIGSLDDDHGSFTVSVDPAPEGLSGTTGNGASHWRAFGATKYFATGMNNSLTYRVEITNGDGTFDLSEVMMYNAVGGSASASSTSLTSGTTASSTPFSSATSSHSVSSQSTIALAPGAIAGITIGGIAILLAVALVVYLTRRRKHRQRILRQQVEAAHPALLVPNMMEQFKQGITAPVDPRYASADSTTVDSTRNFSPLPFSGSTSRSDFNIRRMPENDAGPLRDPPDYQSSWGQRM